MSTLITPCVGKCSTVFGDSVCRGCRRYSHEVIGWLSYSDDHMQAIWDRLDSHLTQIIVPILVNVDLSLVDVFIHNKQLRVPENAPPARRIYEVLRYCERHPAVLSESGLGVLDANFDTVWQHIDQRLYALSIAHFELAWMRAAQFSS